MPLTARDRRTLKFGGIAVGVLLVGFLLFNLLSGGGGNEALFTPSLGPHSPAASPTASASQQPPAPALNGRDPFSIPPGLGGSAPSGSTSSSPPGTSGPTGTRSPTPTPTLPGNGASTRIGGHTVVLLDTYKTADGVSHAQVEVDGTVYSPPVGGRFAGGEFKLVSTSGNCAGLLFGDQSFSLCTTPQK
jgi:hypothetical protein